jgi:hypothetical protein
MLIVGGIVADLLVVGLDLATGLEVHARDKNTEEWREKGHNGDGTLACLACFHGADLPGGPRVVALIPRGRERGARQQHFAHPAGMIPPFGRHSPESLWHAESKQAIRHWATRQGFIARIEAWTAGGRRRSDVEVILPGGRRLAIELQRSELSDAEWIARHNDYSRSGIIDLWLWYPSLAVPRVVFRYDRPGWRFDLQAGTIGLVHAQPGPAVAGQSLIPAQCHSVHWPPCRADQLATIWMPLSSAVLTPGGINPSAEASAELDRLAAIAARDLAAAKRAQAAAAERHDKDQGHSVVWPRIRTTTVATRKSHKFVRVHEAYRYDAFPPWTDPDTWTYRCDVCGFGLTGAMLNASPIIHVVRKLEQTIDWRLREIELRYGGAPGDDLAAIRLTTRGSPATGVPASTAGRTRE